MKIVSEEVSTGISSMPIKYSEKATFWPILHVFLSWWLHYVEDNTNSIFIVVPDDTLVGVGGIPHDVSVLPHTALSGLP
jgi:hypothetical protein